MEKLCDVCGKAFNSSRVDKRTCSGRCQKALQRVKVDSMSESGHGSLIKVDKGLGLDAKVDREEVVRQDIMQQEGSNKRVRCPVTSHPEGCLRCSRLRNETGDALANCGATYYNCHQWGVCIESYHEGMCEEEAPR